MNKYFKLANIAWIGKSCYNELHKKYLTAVANEAWNKDKTDIEESLNNKVFLY